VPEDEGDEEEQPDSGPLGSIIDAQDALLDDLIGKDPGEQGARLT
jgi:hypothetical protein